MCRLAGWGRLVICFFFSSRRRHTRLVSDWSSDVCSFDLSTPMPSDASLFLEALFTGKPDDLHLLLWTLPEKRSQWFQNVESAIQFAESLPERDLYVGVGLSSQDYGSARRCPSNEVAGIVGLWADLDLKSDAHPKA